MDTIPSVDGPRDVQGRWFHQYQEELGLNDILFFLADKVGSEPMKINFSQGISLHFMSCFGIMPL
jgi:hypothetical protein